MSKAFAEKIIESMVDENGHCGERGLSNKQFDILSQYLTEGEWEYVTSWYGSKGGKKDFYGCNYEGTIGKYFVVLNWYAHFHDCFTVQTIDLLPEEELERQRKEAEAEAERKQALKFENGEWVGSPKKRIDFELTLLRKSGYERDCYSGYGYEWVNIYTFADENGNCVVWKSTNNLGYFNDDDEYVEAEVGNHVSMRATVKEHTEWNGIKQTVVLRPKVNAIS